MVPEISVPVPVVTRKVELLSDDAVIGSLNVMLIVDARGTSAAEAAGVLPVTRGAVRSGGVTSDDALSAESAETTPFRPLAETV